MDPFDQGQLADRFTLMGHPPRLRRGFTTWEQLAAPGAGLPLTYKISNTYWERIVALTLTITTSASGSPRLPFIGYQDGSGFQYVTAALGSDIAQSRAYTYNADVFGRPAQLGPVSQSGYGTVTTPAAAATIATISPLQPASYTIEWTVELEGTPAAPADTDNFQLLQGTTVLAQSVNPGAVGVYPQQVQEYDITSAGALSVKSIGAGTTGAIYSASVTAEPTASQGIYAQLPDLVMKSGYQLVIGATNLAAGDQISAAGIITEQYPSNWADGALAQDEEALERLLARLAARGI